MWANDGDLYWLGRIDGAYFYDADGGDADLVHVRPCEWSVATFVESLCPAAAIATLVRGGRNFQRIHDAQVGEQSSQLWDGR